MTSILHRDSYGYSNSVGLQSNRKKVKHFSFNPFDKIGKGFSSVVYKGTNDQTNEVIAVKAIDMKGVKDSVSREMLDCQIEALTKLKNQNILRCYDVIRETSHCYIITEFCNEGDLSGLLKKKRKLPEDEAMKIMKDIVNGYLEIGEKNFLHRDLKLANIFMNNGNAIIADFGFAKKTISSFEKQRYNVGSPLYMPPESLKKNIYSGKSDIWSIGIMLFEMLHGQTPWECRTEPQLIDKMTRIPVRFRDSLNISKDTKDFIKKCLEVDESKRMSLKDLKKWFKEKHGCYSAKDRNQDTENFPDLELKKRMQSEKPALGELTNRLSINQEKNRSYSNLGIGKKDTQNNRNSFASKNNKQNNVSSNASQIPKKMEKRVVDKNNNIFLLEINRFRLIYKIYEKIKNITSEQRSLLNCLGNEILRRINRLMDIITSPTSPKAKEHVDKLGFQEVENYLNETINSGIKKYKSVIKQYHKKYNTEISYTSMSDTSSMSDLLKQYLTPAKVTKENKTKEENLAFYWIVEYCSLPRDVRKEELDSIIEAKKVPESEILLKKLKSL